MKTKTQIIAELKKNYPVIREGSDESGYTELAEVDYLAKIEEWALVELRNQEEAKQLQDSQIKRENAITKLNNLGLDIDDLKALGL